MNLTEVPEIVEWPETHYVFVEKVGPFKQTAPEAWGQMHELVPQLEEANQIDSYLSLYRPGPNIYRAGVAVAAVPETVPDGLRYELFPGGRYSKFTLTGPFTELGAATGRVFAIAAETHLKFREDFCIEHYVKDPRVTPESELVSEILLPTE